MTESLAVNKVDSGQRFEEVKANYKTAFHKGGKPTIAKALNMIDHGVSFKSTESLTVESTGNTKEKMEQMYKDLPVFGAHVVVEEDKKTGEFVSFFGNFYDGIEQDVPDATPKITKSQAVLKAEEKAGDVSKHPEPTTTLQIYVKDSKAYLSYHVVYDILEEKKHMIFEVDAMTGVVLDMYNGFITEVAGGITGATGGIAGGFAG